jgi:hypothetical protein
LYPAFRITFNIIAHISHYLTTNSLWGTDSDLSVSYAIRYVKCNYEWWSVLPVPL